MLSMILFGAAAALQASAPPPARPARLGEPSGTVSFAPGSSFPRHKHPGEEIIYVTQGTIEYEVAGKPVVVKAGEVLFIPSGVVHAARNSGAEPAAELAIYVVRKGQPLVELTE